jgi:asparagine synthase (glutamine-hydrolysing)
VALGHRRLSILDLSPEGRQPMVSACGRYVITFNGEIYNYRSIRNELEGQGRAQAFRGSSDTEVMLAAIRAWGLIPAVKKFIGMFAFALWDQQDKTLSLVRDRIGIKPLYYGWSGKDFLFTSELKALRVHPEFSGEIDPYAVELYFRNMYIPAPYSIYKGVFKLEPGHILTIDTVNLSGIRHSPLSTESYWSAGG